MNFSNLKKLNKPKVLELRVATLHAMCVFKKKIMCWTISEKVRNHHIFVIFPNWEVVELVDLES